MAKSRKEHCKISQLLLGYSDPRVHELMDRAVKWLGAGHRILGHSEKFLDFVEDIMGPQARKEALLHLLIDAKIIELPRTS